MGAILVNLLFPGRKRRAAGGEEAERPAPERRGPSIFDSVRDALLRAATPWITRFVAEKIAAYMDRKATARPDADKDDRAG